MADVFTQAKRSAVMARIRSRGNQDTELVLARLLRAHKISGWRRHALLKFQVSSSKFQVKPDFVFRRQRVAVFVDGCFWHGCPRHATKPKNHRAFWQRKLAANQERDRRVNRTLRRAGWRVVRIWECALAKRPESCLRRVARAVG
jgi:DNA mismatch endonuclease (patch repair protein)